jgi:hypothetical protein
MLTYALVQAAAELEDARGRVESLSEERVRAAAANERALAQLREKLAGEATRMLMYADVC